MPGTKKVLVRSVGCKLNQVETERILDSFQKAGFSRAHQESDVCIINTCTVTDRADRKTRNMIRRIRAANPEARIVVTGCFATTNNRDIEDIDPGILVVPNKDKDKIFDIVNKAFYSDELEKKGNSLISGLLDRSRAYVKIQDGCNCRCAYCKVWQARGPSLSLDPSRIYDQVSTLAGKGFKEVVLTGVNITEYNQDHLTLAGLLEGLLKRDFPVRIRLSSLKPERITPDLTAVVSDSRICDHFHISLQSGSDRILKKMNRQYTALDFRKAVEVLRKARPDAGFGADVITGFPGETEEDFLETYRAIEDCSIPYLHVFRYSDRENTPAAGMVPKVPLPVMTDRSQRLEVLREKICFAFRKNFLDHCLESVVEKNKVLSSNYISIILKQGLNSMSEDRQIARVRITEISSSETCGELEQP